MEKEHENDRRTLLAEWEDIKAAEFRTIDQIGQAIRLLLLFRVLRRRNRIQLRSHRSLPPPVPLLLPCLATRLARSSVSMLQMPLPAILVAAVWTLPYQSQSPTRRYTTLLQPSRRAAAPRERLVPTLDCPSPTMASPGWRSERARSARGRHRNRSPGRRRMRTCSRENRSLPPRMGGPTCQPRPFSVATGHGEQAAKTLRNVNSACVRYTTQY